MKKEKYLVTKHKYSGEVIYINYQKKFLTH